MSKMPAKKKSCFQITSVTTAQAANSLAEDTESLEDPDESRTEDVSSEIFDVSRATDYGGPEDVVERSSSEETLSNVGEADTPGTMSPNLPQEPGPVTAARGGMPSTPGGHAHIGHVLPAAPSAPTAGAPANSPSTASGTATCSSRFRVIKLDHGSGEPYRRGRWTCTDYYDRDSDSSILSRAGDSIRHGSTFEHPAADRDSGLGATGGSVVASALHMAHGPESLADSSLTAVSQLLHTDKVNQPSPQQHFIIGQQSIGGAVSQGGAQPMYPSPAALTSQHMLGQQTPSHGTAPSIGHNGKGTAAQNVTLVHPPVSNTQQQTSASVSQAQPFAYPQAQVQSGLMSTQASGQTEYVQHITVIQSQGTTQKATTTSVTTSTGAPSSLPGQQQHLQAGGAQLMGLLSKPSDSLSQGLGLLQSGQTPPSHPVHIQQQGGVAQSNMASFGVMQQKTITPQVSGVSHVSGIPGGHSVLPSGMQNVSVAAPGTGVSSVPSVSATPVTMPTAPTTIVQSQISSHTSVRSNSLVTAVGLPTMQGTANVHNSLPQSNINPFQSQPLTGQIDDRRKSEPLPQPPISLISEKSFVKVPITDSLTNPLHLPVFGLPIPVDGDDDSLFRSTVLLFCFGRTGIGLEQSREQGIS
ncbi:Hypothetical predicted protein [Pelobates cultripes]|uniref:TSC22 domain family member 2 n=1 Tax=Pelobates cultripes TaxID=61616 RepID=A0AAD1RBH9_PELCU|nr:Hypothetical predicted protein [Pelobates cultripes]